MSISLIQPQTCRSCKFRGEHQTMGPECRRMPPVAQSIVVGTKAGPQVAGRVGTFPPIELDSWCGEWKQRIEVAHDIPIMEMRGKRQ